MNGGLYFTAAAVIAFLIFMLKLPDPEPAPKQKGLWHRLRSWFADDDAARPYDQQAALPAPRPNHNLVNQTLVEMSPEQTARWISNPEAEPWLKHVSHPELRESLVRQQRLLHDALFASADLYVKALRVESRSSAERLEWLAHRARQGDARSTALMLAMMGELINTALTDLE